MAPNMVLILSDDLGYNDVTYHGSNRGHTPFIDQIAAEGVQFTAAYAASTLCSPSRAALITGRYNDRFGYRINPSLTPFDVTEGLPFDEATLGEVLQGAGYDTVR